MHYNMHIQAPQPPRPRVLIIVYDITTFQIRRGQRHSTFSSTNLAARRSLYNITTFESGAEGSSYHTLQVASAATWHHHFLSRRMSVLCAEDATVLYTLQFVYPRATALAT